MGYRVPVSTVARHVSNRLEVEIRAQADLIFSVDVSAEYPEVAESLSFCVGEVELVPEEVVAPSGSRLHRLRETPVGTLVVDYRADVLAPAPEPPMIGIDEILYTRPSRYCDSDRLANLSGTHFAGLSGQELVASVREWVHNKIGYRLGSSRSIDGALDTYLTRNGVCRDFSHLVVAFLRGLNLPARFVSVYAPGLRPMDFHAVSEVYVDGAWQLLDATGLAPRETMVRICTGRDASDTAFMTTLGGRTRLASIRVDASIDGDLPEDDGLRPVELR